MSAVFDLKAKLLEMGITPKKAFGQNFLINQHVIRKIVETVIHHDFEDLVEVGPGLGALTELLLEAKLKPRVIELDRELVAYWQKRGLEVHEADALQFNWDDLHLKSPALFVSNLPYQISTSIVIDRCFGPLAINTMVLMFQKEVAQRLMAQTSTKEYGFLSVMTQLHFKMSKVADAAPRDFFPAPKIASRVLLFERLPTEGLGRPFLSFLKQAFAFRRKFLLKNLKSAVNPSTVARLPAVAEELGISAKARAEELTPQQFVEFFKRLKSEH
ncbi:MAG: 16S rRNA (adenine(1518)-N(6)/adenine(1519)-N(6))-dimethyltransferase RsmA [Bdellovibrionales bacterium]